MRFAADRMLGKLAKWLRILGYDTLYARGMSQEEFMGLAAEGRILLSRNTRLRKRIPQDSLVFVESNDPAAQLQNLVRALNLVVNPERFFTRCTVCNGRLEPVKIEEVAGKVPDYIWTRHDRFSKCKNCGKIYWPGSHMARSRVEIGRVLGDPGDGRTD
jgi:uncharacterized protein with PIN domain